MTGHYVPDAKREFHYRRRINRRVAWGMSYNQAKEAESRIRLRLSRFIDYIHDNEFAEKMAERFQGGVDPR